MSRRISMANPRNPSGEQPWPAERPAEPEIERQDVDREGTTREDIVGFGDDEDDEDVDPDSADSENDRDDTIDDV
jgi:hypothetical protein